MSEPPRPRFVVRTPQIHRVREAIELSQVHDIAAHLQAGQTAGVSGLSQDELYHRVRLGMERALSRGIGGTVSTILFISLMLEVAPNFDDHPKVKAVLKDPNGLPDENILKLSEQMSAEDWFEARQNADASLWARE